MAIKLPEREYLTFAELLERWVCEENDIRRLIINRQLIPSYVMNDTAGVVTFVESEESEESGRRIWIPDSVENDVEHENEEDRKMFKCKTVWTDGFYYLLHPWQTASLDCQFVFFSQDKNHKEESGDTCFMVRPKIGNTIPITLDDVIENGVVMKPQVLSFEEKTKTPDSLSIDHKPLSTKERNTLLTIIAVLCKEAKLDYTTASKTADLIAGMAASMEVSISKTAIRDHLKKIPDALGTRTR